MKAAYNDARPPKEVHQAFLAFVAAMAASLLSSIVGLVFSAFILSSLAQYGGGVAGAGIAGGVIGLVISLVILAAVFFVVVQMRAGANWARITLTVLGGIAAIFNIIGIFGALALFAFSGIYGILSLVFSVAITALLVGAIVLMWRPANASYFR